MTSPTLTDAPRRASESTVPSDPHPCVPALTSAILLWTAFPPTDAGWLAWVSLAPLFALVKSRRSRGSVYGAAWLGGFVFWLLAIQWVRLTDDSAWLAWCVMALVLSAWWPAALALTRLAVTRLRWPLMLAAPVIWVGLEHLRAYVLTGFPWYYVAHTQHATLPLIQIADLAGSLGVSFLIALVNAWWVEVLTNPLFLPSDVGPRLSRKQLGRAAIVGAALALTLGYGMMRLATANFRRGPRIALLQSDLVQRYKMSGDPRELVDIYQSLIQRATAAARPDLICWPETSYPYGYISIAPGLSPSLFSEQVRQIGPELKPSSWSEKAESVEKHLHEWTDALGVPMLVGTLMYEHRADGLGKYNSAVLFEPGRKTVQTYNKIHLVPFGEFVPFVETLPWLVALTPYQGSRIPSLTFGHDPAWFQLGPYRLATAICFEDSVPHVVRRFFSEHKSGIQPDILLNLSNDGWFHGSSEHEMHLFVSVFRAIENRVPLARAVNTGISAIIDGNGRVVAALAKARPGVLSEIVPLDDRTAFYSAVGDWLGISCLAILVVVGPLALLRPRVTAPPL